MLKDPTPDSFIEDYVFERYANGRSKTARQALRFSAFQLIGRFNDVTIERVTVQCAEGQMSKIDATPFLLSSIQP